MMMRPFVFIALTVFASAGFDAFAQEQALTERVFSGPQVGEKLPPFLVRGVFDEDAGKDLDFVKQADGKPIVLVFMHDPNRQSIGMTRALTTYTVRRKPDGLTTGVVWLDDDATEAEAMLKRVRHALAPGAPTGVSLDGKEGPGSYGLNRNVMLTILVGNEGKVTANFALVQPSLQADLPRILGEIVAVAGGSVPSVAELTANGAMRKSAVAGQDPMIRALLRPLIQKDAEPEAVDRAATAVEEYAEKNNAARDEIGRIANTIVDSGKLENYGSDTGPGISPQVGQGLWLEGEIRGQRGEAMTVAALAVISVLLVEAPAPIRDFDTQVVPILTKAGCNAGSCHGAAAGRGGFHLSLLGGDPAFDYESITQNLEGRRIDLVRPRSSLLLAKPTGVLLHGGDIPLDGDGPEALAWPPGSPPAPLAEIRDI